MANCSDTKGMKHWRMHCYWKKINFAVLPLTLLHLSHQSTADYLPRTAHCRHVLFLNYILEYLKSCTHHVSIHRSLSWTDCFLLFRFGDCGLVHASSPRELQFGQFALRLDLFPQIEHTLGCIQKICIQACAQLMLKLISCGFSCVERS